MSCDASPTGLGVVLSHITDEGEKPIAYLSRALAPAEKNYSQLEKEGLAIIFGVKKLHQYLYGHKFVIYTDHKPLLGLSKPDRATPTMAAARIQRWALILAGCILWGSRVVSPEPGREKLLNLLHEGHPGIVRMKSLARSYLWWPGLEDTIEGKVLRCEDCQMQSAAPAVAPLHLWEWPDRPWSRLHADYAGTFMGSMFLIIIDAYRK